MPVTVAQLSDQLIKSGLLPEEQIRAAAQSVGGLSEEASSESLARQLVRDGRLTLFQAQQAVNGKAAALILGSYVILEKLGQGGMGQVFRARHRTMKREVALKVISSAVVKDETSLKRFQREVEAAAQLNHPNIVTAHDAGEHKGTHFLVMELVRGSDLSSAVKKAGPMKSSQAVQCVMQAARGLAYAHSNGIVHRDIKPANLLLDESGTIKILDMGLARFEDGGQDHASVAGLTGTGMLMGTIDYMSPEQAMDSKTADARSDIYSLGCTLFFLMTGKAVYEEDTVMKRVMAHQAAPIPQLPMLDSQLQSIFARSIAKRPEQRFQSMDQLVQELQSWLARSSDAAVGPTAEMPLTGGSGLVIPDDVVLKDEGPKSSVQTLQPPAESSLDTTPSMSAAAQTLGSQPKKPMTANESFGRKTGPQAAAEAATRAGSVTTAGAKKVSTGTSARPTASSGGSSRSGLAPAGVAGDDEIPISEATAGSLPPRRRSTQRLTLENRRPPKQPAGKKILAAFGGGAFLLVLLGIIVITIRDKDGNEAVIKVPEGTEVAVEITQIPDSVSREATAHSAANGNAPDPVSIGWYGWPVDAPKPAIAPFDAAQAKKHQEEWAAYLKVPVEYTNSIGMKFRLIPPGEFTMGMDSERAKLLAESNNSLEFGRLALSSSPEHRVVLTQPYYIGICEVTQDEYQRVIGSNPSSFSANGGGRDAVTGLDTRQHPVEGVSFNDAAQYCMKLSDMDTLSQAYTYYKKEILSSSGIGYRLPTEAEWENACRAGTGTNWFCDDDDLLKVAWFVPNANGTTHPVGQLQPNAFGLFDVYGNVYEFCQDWYDPEAYKPRAGELTIDPQGNTNPAANMNRTVRGFAQSDIGIHGSGFRYRTYPAYRDPDRFGFRLTIRVEGVRQLLKQQPKGNASDATGLPADASSLELKAQPIPNAPQPTSPNSSMVVAAPILIPPVDPLSEIPAGAVTALPFDPGPAAKWKVGDPISPRALVGSPEPIRNLASWSVETVSHLVWPGSIRVSPDGQRVATCGTVDATVRIWKLPTDRQQSASLERILLGESGSVADAVWSHSGRLIATTNQNQKVISVYDAVSGHRLMSVPNEHGGASTLHWSPDDTKILLPSWYLCVLDLATRELKKSEPAKNFHRGAWSPDGREIATLCEGDGGKVTFWDSETLKLLSESSDPSLFQTSGFGWSPDGKWLAVGGRNGRVSLWDTTTRRKAKDVVTNESVDWAHFSWERTPPTGEAKHPRWPRLMLTSSYLSEIWDAELTTKLTSCNSVSNQVCGDWLPDGKRVVTVGTAFPLPQVFDAETGEKASVATSQPPNYQGTFSVSPDGKTLRALYDEELLIFNAESGEYLKKFSRVAGRQLSTSPKDDWIVVYYKDADDQPVVMVDTATYEKRIPLAGHRGKVTAVNWSADNQFLATCDSAGVLRIWKAADQSLVQEIKSARPLLSVIWSPDGKQLATAADDRIIRLWNTQTWTQTREFPPVDLLVATGPNVISWCPTADQIAVATNAANVQVLDIKTGVFSEPVINLSVGLTGVTWSPDGRQLLAGNGGHGGSEIGLRIVRAKSFTSAHGHGDPIQWLPDSQRLITGQAVAAAIQAIDARRKTRLGALIPRMPDGGWLCIGADGHYRGSEGIEKQIVYVALHKDGSQTTHTPADFGARFGWKNDPSKASFLKLNNDSQ